MKSVISLMSKVGSIHRQYGVKLFAIAVVIGGIQTHGAPAEAATSSLTIINAAQVVPGGTISLSVVDGVAAPGDWVGLYSATQSGGNTSVGWQYLNGAQTAPSVGISSATLQFALPTTQNISYFFVLYNNNGTTFQMLSVLLLGTVSSTSPAVTIGLVQSTATATPVLPQPTKLVVASNTNNYNIFSAAGSPTMPVVVQVTINSGVTIGSTSTSTPALVTGNFPAGSIISIVNNGTIAGAGGAGGNGVNGQINGGNGGPAISLGSNVSITNAGYILGGGGGGGGNLGYYGYYGYNGGGGGCGITGGVAGAMASGTYYSVAGTAGSTSPGAGGVGSYAAYFGAGGSGGCWGRPGSPGSTGYYGSSAGSGGAAGSAILVNGHSLTWVSGNSASQVQGAVN